jgi:hypothetical protein
MNIIEEIKQEWKQYKLQIIGTVILTIPSIVLGLLQEWGIGVGFLICILLLDLWLIYTKQDTITKWIRRQFPGWADKLVLAGLTALIVYFAGYGAGYWFFLGTINGHINWER